LKPVLYVRFQLDSFRKTKIFRCMAELDEKWPENVKGKFYVDEQCIDCDLCRETAPENFTRDEDGGYSFVYKQPTSQEETDLCMEALEGCPVEAIGEDGE
jgi:ferredoxin